MSFAAEVKKELTSLEVHREHAKAELAALIRMNGSLSINNQQFVLNVQTENAAIARRIYSLLKDHYNVRSELLVRRKMKLKKNNVYIVRLKQETKRVLLDLDIMDGLMFHSHVSDEIMGNAQKMRSYLRGAFMASGSVNNPETSRYHLEIYSIYEEHNQDICDMLNYYGLNARALERRNGFISYLKGAEKIADFLTLNKTIDAASKQIDNIEFIQQRVGLGALPEKLQEIAELRLEHPEVSLKELGEMIPSGAISKSGINHRIRKINEFADRLRDKVS